MKTEDPSVQAFPPRAIRLRHPSVPPVSWMSVSAFRLGVIRLGSSVSGSSVSGSSVSGTAYKKKSTSSTLISPHTALQPTTTHSFIKYSKTAITTKTCQTNLKTIIIPNTLINAHTPYACIISKYITRQNMAFSRSSLPHTHKHTHTQTHRQILLTQTTSTQNRDHSPELSRRFVRRHNQ